MKKENARKHYLTVKENLRKHHKDRGRDNMPVSITESDNGTKDKVANEIARIGYELPEAVRAELDEIWAKIEQAAIDICPKDTGALASTIKTSEGGGAIGMTSMSTNDIYNKTLIAGDEAVINRKTGKSTAEYAGWIHDGHMMRDGTFWNGVPFLVEGFMMYEEELNAAIDKALSELQGGKTGEG